MGKQCSWFEQYSPVMAMGSLQFVYAFSSLSAKAVFAEGMSPMVFAVYRQVIASLALAPFAILTKRRRGASQVALGIRGFSLLFLASFVGVTLNIALYYQGLKLAPASFASAVTNIIPAITFLMAASVGLERVDVRSARSMAKIFGTIVCVGGAVSMALFKGPKLMNPSSESLFSIFYSAGDNWIIGCLFLFGSSCCWSLMLILQVPICKNYLDPLSLATLMCMSSSLQLAVVTLFLEQDPKAWRVNSSFELSCCLYSGVMGSAVTFYVQSWCITKRGPLFSAMFNPVNTVIVTILAILLLHEHIFIGSMFGAAAVVIGLYVVLWGKAKDCDDNTTKIPTVSIDVPAKNSETNIREPLLNRKLQDVAETV